MSNIELNNLSLKTFPSIQGIFYILNPLGPNLNQDFSYTDLDFFQQLDKLTKSQLINNTNRGRDRHIESVCMMYVCIHGWCMCMCVIASGKGVPSRSVRVRVTSANICRILHELKNWLWQRVRLFDWVWPQTSLWLCRWPKINRLRIKMCLMHARTGFRF